MPTVRDRVGKELTTHEVENFVRGGRETDDLAFRESLRLDTDRGRAVFFRDVAAFTNFIGGHILVGVSREGRPVGSLEDLDERGLRRLVESFFGGRLLLQYKVYELSDRSPVGLIFVPGIAQHLVIIPRSLEAGEDSLAAGDIYCRRDGRSVKARSADFNLIITKIMRDRGYVLTQPPRPYRKPLDERIGRPLDEARLARAVSRGRQGPEMVFLAEADLETPRGRSDLVRAVAGLANARGGYVVLGVDERGRPVPTPGSLDRPAVTGLVREVLGEDLGLEFGEVSVGGARLPTMFLYGADHVVAAEASCGDPEGPRDRYVAEGDVYYRRGAETVRAGSREFEAIIKKIVSAKDYFKVAGPW
ncbi:MAG TPA: hypothetical protein DGR79_02165 [Clostridiales bacterium]|nr:hypothetical protein [Clostridiales bacterium]